MSSTVNVGIVMPNITNALRKLVADGDVCDINEAFAQAVALKVAEHGGVSAIQATHAPGRPLKLMVIMEGTEPEEPVHVWLR